MFWMLPLAGAALGALASKDDPLKGAMMGAALGATGGALAPAGLLGAGAASAGAAGTAAAGATAATAGAATAGAAAAGAGAAGAAATAGTAAAANPLAAYLATGAAEGSTLGSALTGAGGASGAVGQGTTAGLLGNLQQASAYAKPAMQGLQAAQTAQGLMAEPPPPDAPQLQQGAPLDLSSIFQSHSQSQMSDMEEQMRRQKELEQYATNMMGSRNG